MKKLGLTLVAIGLFFITAQAQVEGELEAEGEIVAVVGEEFEKIEVSALPEAVTASTLTQFPDAITTEAYLKNVDEEVIYKVELDLNGQIKKVYLDSDGNLLKKEDKKEESN